MIFEDNSSGKALEADVCIIGGGPAAITIALKLAEKINTSVIVLVGGSATRESASDQDLNRGLIPRVGSHESLEENRRRVFGGASSAWGGRCIPFDPIDFKSRSWIPESGWPITYEELEPFYRQALKLCRAGEYEFDSRAVFGQDEGEIIKGMDSDLLESWHLERWSPPINFAVEFRQELDRSPSISVFLNTHVLGLAATHSRDEIGVVTAISKGARFEVKAKTFVLATGGIENARILLASRNQFHSNGVGNDHDLVGRYYQAHPHGTYISLAPHDRKHLMYEYERDQHDVYCRRRWWVTEKAQRELGIGNVIFFLDRTNPSHGHRDAIFSAVYVAKAVLSIIRARGTSKKLARLKKALPDIRQHIGTIIKDGPMALPRALLLAKARTAKDRRLPSVLPSVNSRYLGIYYQAEQVPNRDSRITLSNDEADEFGTPRVVMDLSFTEQDIQTIVKGHRIFMESYNRVAAGEMVYDEQEFVKYVRSRFLNFNSAAHHIGTTRMSLSAVSGVVDENCKVHGLTNLYIAGSSVFPTGGHANPTLTIVALALRLGEHLARLP